MKKSEEPFFLSMLGIFYLIIASSVSISTIDMLKIVIFTLNFLCVLLGICGAVFVHNAYHIQVNYRTNFMAVSTLLISSITALQLTCRYEMQLNVYYIYEYTKSLTQLICVVLCLKLINEKISWRREVAAALLVLAGAGAAVGCYFMAFEQADPLRGVYTGRLHMKVFTLVFAAGCVIGCLKELKQSASLDRKLFIHLFCIQLGIAVLEILTPLKRSYPVDAVVCLLQCMYSLCVLNYIEENTLGLTWKKLTLVLKDKELAVRQGANNKKVLIKASTEIQEYIKKITQGAELLEEKVLQDYEGKDKEYLEKIKNNCSRLSKLSRRIVNLDDIDKLQSEFPFKRTNVAALVKETITSIEPYIDETGMKLDYAASSEEIIGEVNEEGIERIVMNLLSNAVKYNRAQGSIIVRLSEKDDKIFFSVKDTGVGIPENSMKKIFSKYERVERKSIQLKEGSGLGLAIVKTLVTLHKGEISVASKVGKGTIISVNLPVSQKEDQASDTV